MKKAIICLTAWAFILTGCTGIAVEKEDGTKVTVTTFGSSKIGDMTYRRTEKGITLTLGNSSNTPERMPEIIQSAGDAVGRAVKNAITP